jgi:hypothetical protein
LKKFIENYWENSEKPQNQSEDWAQFLNIIFFIARKKLIGFW